ncbi:hypothetical protein [Albimonas donghaensis]|uniref:hypothetical protein n=1 Tax=Albimonas donghaensis TaxID=356660 RepID=UPI00115FB0F4|nr:hypothetical protein [Albimonas donghaensis]
MVDAVFLADAAGDAREGNRGAPMTAHEAGSSAEAHRGDLPAATGDDHRFVFDAERRRACFARSHGTAGAAQARFRRFAIVFGLTPQRFDSALRRSELAWVARRTAAGGDLRRGAG